MWSMQIAAEESARLDVRSLRRRLEEAEQAAARLKTQIQGLQSKNEAVSTELLQAKVRHLASCSACNRSIAKIPLHP